MMGTTISWDAADYARNSEAQLGWARELLDKLSLGGDEALLDIGCGDGKVSADLSRRLSSGSVLGIDSSAGSSCCRWEGEGMRPIQAGLMAESIELMAESIGLIPKDMTHQNPEALAGWVRTTWLPYTQRVPEGQRQAFVDELMARYLGAHPPDGEGRTHVRMVRLEVRGHKVGRR